MILLMSIDPISKQAANQLGKITGEEVRCFQDVNLSDIQDKSITLVDLRADSTFQDSHDAQAFADFFRENNVSNILQKIYLMISDVNPDDSLLAFAYSFNAQMQAYHINLSMHACGDANASITFIEAPKEDTDWKIYAVGLPGDANLANPYSYQQFQHALPHMALIWQGESIHSWFDKSSLMRNGIFFDKLAEQRRKKFLAAVPEPVLKANAPIELSPHNNLLNGSNPLPERGVMPYEIKEEGRNDAPIVLISSAAPSTALLKSNPSKRSLERTPKSHSDSEASPLKRNRRSSVLSCGFFEEKSCLQADGSDNNSMKRNLHQAKITSDY